MLDITVLEDDGLRGEWAPVPREQMWFLGIGRKWLKNQV